MTNKKPSALSSPDSELISIVTREKIDNVVLKKRTVEEQKVHGEENTNGPSKHKQIRSPFLTTDRRTRPVCAGARPPTRPCRVARGAPLEGRLAPGVARKEKAGLWAALALGSTSVTHTEGRLTRLSRVSLAKMENDLNFQHEGQRTQRWLART